MELEIDSKYRRPPTFSFRTTADLRQESRKLFIPDLPIETDSRHHLCDQNADRHPRSVLHGRQPNEKIPFSPQRLRGTEFKNKVIPYNPKNSVSLSLCGGKMYFLCFSLEFFFLHQLNAKSTKNDRKADETDKGDHDTD